MNEKSDYELGNGEAPKQNSDAYWTSLSAMLREVADSKSGVIEIDPVAATAILDKIFELNVLVAELKPYRDGYDPEKDFPPEGENVIAEIGGWMFLVQRRGDEWFYSHGDKAQVMGRIKRWWKLPESPTNTQTGTIVYKQECEK